MLQADFPCRHSRSRPIAMPAFLAGFRLPPQGPALKALRLERLSAVVVDQRTAGGVLYGSVSKPCTPVVHIKIAGISGCSSHKKWYFHRY